MPFCIGLKDYIICMCCVILCGFKVPLCYLKNFSSCILKQDPNRQKRQKIQLFFYDKTNNTTCIFSDVSTFLKLSTKQNLNNS